MNQIDCTSSGVTLRNAGFFLCAVIFLVLNAPARSQEQNAFLLPCHAPGKQSLSEKVFFM